MPLKSFISNTLCIRHQHFLIILKMKSTQQCSKISNINKLSSLKHTLHTYQAGVFCKTLAEHMREVSLHMELLPLLWSGSLCLAAGRWRGILWWADLSPLVATHQAVAHSSPPCKEVVHRLCCTAESPLCSKKDELLQSLVRNLPVLTCLSGFWRWLYKKAMNSVHNSYLKHYFQLSTDLFLIQITQVNWIFHLYSKNFIIF